MSSTEWGEQEIKKGYLEKKDNFIVNEVSWLVYTNLAINLHSWPRSFESRLSLMQDYKAEQNFTPFV